MEEEQKGLDRRIFLAGGVAALLGVTGAGYWSYATLARWEEIRRANEVPLPPPGASLQPLRVLAASYPAQWVLERLAVDRFNIRCILPPGEDPRTWQPDASMLVRLESARLIIANGAGYEPWLSELSLPADRLHRLIPSDVGLISEGAGAGGRSVYSTHTWADPILFLRQAETLLPVIEAIDPAGAPEFRSNMGLLRQDLEALVAELRSVIQGQRRIRFAASSTVYGYLARRFGLDVLPFDLSPTRPMANANRGAFASWLEGQFAPTIFWHAPPAEAVKAALPSIIQHVYVDPLDAPIDLNGRKTYDYVKQMRRNIEVFRRVFAGL